MAGLTETVQWEDDIYQIETNDPVVGGPPNLAQGNGITNVPHLELANRTAWLRQEILQLQTDLAQFVTDPELAAAIANFITQGDLDAAIATLVDSAPGTLDTLREIAEFAQNNESAIAGLTAALGAKLDASAYTAADVLAKLLTVHGSGSGLNADLLDGLDSSHYVNASSLTLGTLPDGRLPTRLSTAAFNLSGHPGGNDWNAAVTNGWYQAISAANAPETGVWYIGEVVTHDATNWVVQTVHSFTDGVEADTHAFRRRKQAGNWTTWERVRSSETELIALMQANPTGFGVGQTRQDMAGSRALNTTYQNTTGRPIEVSITQISSAYPSIQVGLDSANMLAVGGQTNDRSHPDTHHFTVLDGEFYRANGDSLLYWTEVRS